MLMQAVRFDEYGGIDVLKVVDVPTPEPGPGQVLVQVKAAGINPGEGKIRDGLLDAMFPATFPSGEGSDLAGVVAKTGPGVTGWSAGDEVIGYTDNRASHAEYVLVEAFRDDAAGAAHVQSDHFRKAQESLPPHLARTPRIINFKVPQDDWSLLGELAVPE